MSTRSKTMTSQGPSRTQLAHTAKNDASGVTPEVFHVIQQSGFWQSLDQPTRRKFLRNLPAISDGSLHASAEGDVVWPSWKSDNFKSMFHKVGVLLTCCDVTFPCWCNCWLLVSVLLLLLIAMLAFLSSMFGVAVIVCCCCEVCFH